MRDNMIIYFSDTNFVWCSCLCWWWGYL